MNIGHCPHFCHLQYLPLSINLKPAFSYQLSLKLLPMLLSSMPQARIARMSLFDVLTIFLHTYKHINIHIYTYKFYHYIKHCSSCMPPPISNIQFRGSISNSPEKEFRIYKIFKLKTHQRLSEAGFSQQMWMPQPKTILYSSLLMKLVRRGHQKNMQSPKLPCSYFFSLTTDYSVDKHEKERGPFKHQKP